MFTVGRVCVKIAGREAGHKCVIVKKVDKNFVMIDGDVRRRKCNINHLIPLEYELSIKSTTKSDEIKKELVKMGLMVNQEKKRKEKKTKTPRPKKQHKKKEKPVKKETEAKTPAKKTAAKKTVKKTTTKKTVKKTAAKK